MKNVKKEDLSKTELTQRWSKSLVEKYAPAPYRTIPNQYGGPGRCYYLISDIERIEQMPEFQRELRKIKERREKRRMPVPGSYTLF